MVDIATDERVPFKSANALVSYVDTHSKTERALIRIDQFAVFILTAGYDIDAKHINLDTRDFVSLRDFDVSDLVHEARMRIFSGEVNQEVYESFWQQKTAV